MAVKLYQLYCDFCGYKRISDGSDVKDLREVKTSPIPGGIPFIDPLTKKVVAPKSSSQRKRFKCPKCGRSIMARQIQKTEHIPDEADTPDGNQTGTPGPSFP